MSDWWASRLGGPAPPAVSPSLPPHAPVQPWSPPRAAPEAEVEPAANGRVTMHNLIEAMGAWKGGEGQRNSTICPGCGGKNLFRRQVGAVEAAPLCYDCGWNGLWQQVQPRT